MTVMYKTVAILGRQPALGIAELESLYGANAIRPFGQTACLLDESVDIDFSRLGGSTRVGQIIAEIEASNWHTVEKHILENIEDIFPVIDGKLSFGVSSFGCKTNKQKVAKTALLIKKAIKSSGQSVRMVPHKGIELNSATVLYNKLTKDQGFELLIIGDGKKTVIAQTIDIQDIDAYAARDRDRPMRDAKVGMLPPKLAQIIINIGAGPRYNEELRVLDPFCGTGVALQEAMLMDYDIYGTDLEPRMIEYSIGNLNWLDQKYPDARDYRRIEVGDAATFTWNEPEKITTVAGETYLGQPLTTLPNSEHLSKIMQEVNALHHKFLKNIGEQIRPGTRLCLAIPTWRGKREFLHLSVLDYLSDLGYTRIEFEHVSTEDLIYHRDGQVVGRELLVLIKN